MNSGLNQVQILKLNLQIVFDFELLGASIGGAAHQAEEDREEEVAPALRLGDLFVRALSSHSALVAVALIIHVEGATVDPLVPSWEHRVVPNVAGQVTFKC